MPLSLINPNFSYLFLPDFYLKEEAQKKAFEKFEKQHVKGSSATPAEGHISQRYESKFPVSYLGEGRTAQSCCLSEGRGCAFLMLGHSAWKRFASKPHIVIINLLYYRCAFLSAVFFSSFSFNTKQFLVNLTVWIQDF